MAEAPTAEDRRHERKERHRPLARQQHPHRQLRALRRRDQPRDRPGHRPGRLRRTRSRPRASSPRPRPPRRTGRRPRSATRTQVVFRFRELLNERKEELAAIITAEHGKVLSDALGEVSPRPGGRRVRVRHPAPAQGRHSESVSTGVDLHSMRQPLGVVGIISPFNFPAMVPMWFFPIAIGAGQHRRPQAQREGPVRRDLDGRAVEGGRSARRRLQRAAGRQGRGRRAAGLPRRRVDQLRRLDPDRRVRLRAREPGRQAGPGPRRRQEPHARAARRRPRPRRRRRGQRRLRLGRRALHGDQRRRRGRHRSPTTSSTGSPRAPRPCASATAPAAPTWDRSSRRSTATRSRRSSRPATRPAPSS